MPAKVFVLVVLFCSGLCAPAEEAVPALTPVLRANVEPSPVPPHAGEHANALNAAAPHSGGRAPVHFTFAVPDYDSRISLGVFDSSGNMVRIIASARLESDFQIGLNGLLSQWDWNDENGNPVPDGEYFIRGYAIGEFGESERRASVISWGDAFGPGLELSEIRQLGIGPDGILFILGTDIENRFILLAYDTAQETRLWSRTLGQSPGENWILGQPTSPVLAVMGNGELEIIEPGTGRVLLRGRVSAAGEHVHSLRLAAEELQWVTDSGVQRVSMVDLSPLEPLPGLPGQIVRYHGDDSGGIALDKDGRLWVGAPGWTIFLNQDGAWFRDFAPGRDGRFWALVRERKDGEQRLGQFQKDGEFLRQIHPETFHGSPAVFAAGSDETTLFVLSKNLEDKDRQLVGIRRKILEGPSAWETFWEKRLDPEETLQRDGFRSLPLRMKLEVTSALGMGRETSIFRLAVGEAGIELLTPEGLKLGTIWKGTGILAASAAPAPDNPRALRFRVLTEEGIQEGEITGLDRMVKLNAGRFVWPPEEE